MQAKERHRQGGANRRIQDELEEAETDPVFTGQYDARGCENAGKQVRVDLWRHVRCGQRREGQRQAGTRDYLIQRNRANASGGYCSMSH